jgi:glycosyltransferase involved in cell wall biosynthesis
MELKKHKIEDLVKDIPYVKYIRLHKKVSLGAKRNLMHANCSGDILVYMDDDDYYPPTRISHAVSKLTSSSNLCAGSSTIHILFQHRDIHGSLIILILTSNC